MSIYIYIFWHIYNRGRDVKVTDRMVSTTYTFCFNLFSKLVIKLCILRVSVPLMLYYWLFLSNFVVKSLIVDNEAHAMLLCWWHNLYKSEEGATVWCFNMKAALNSVRISSPSKSQILVISTLNAWNVPCSGKPKEALAMLKIEWQTES